MDGGALQELFDYLHVKPVSQGTGRYQEKRLILANESKHFLREQHDEAEPEFRRKYESFSFGPVEQSRKCTIVQHICKCH